MEKIMEKLWKKYQEVIKKPKDQWTQQDKTIYLNGNLNFNLEFNKKFSKLMGGNLR